MISRIIKAKFGVIYQSRTFGLISHFYFHSLYEDKKLVFTSFTVWWRDKTTSHLQEL